MTNKLMKWHLAHDNQLQLSHFCDKHQVDRHVGPYYQRKESDENYFLMTTYFNNGAFITAELIQGTSINENYQVLDYGWGNI